MTPEFVAQVTETPGHRFLVVSLAEGAEDRVAFPITDAAFVENEGRRWRLDGTEVDTTIVCKRGLMGLGDLFFLRKGVSVQLEIAPQLSGDLVIRAGAGYAPDDLKRLARQSVTPWSGEVKVGRIP